MHYDPDALRPVGATVSVITHHHDDHFDAGLFLSRPGWRIIGPPSVTARLPLERVLSGDSVTVGAFTVNAIQSPHTDDHRSYRIRGGAASFTLRTTPRTRGSFRQNHVQGTELRLGAVTPPRS